MSEKEILEYIKETVKKHPMTYSMILFSKKNCEIRDYIYEKTKNFNIYEKFTKRSRVYCVLNGITGFPKCKMCGSEIVRNIKAVEHGGGFAKYCSPKCENKDPEVIEKLNITNMKIYGCPWSFQSDNNKSKTKKTMMEKYGVEYAQQNKTIKQKSYDTMENRYGDRFPNRVKSIVDKGLRKKRNSAYDKFLKLKDIQPMFSREEYIEFGNDIKYAWKCNVCGTEFESFIDKSWFKQGQNRTYARCEKCYPRESGTSSGEQDMISYIKSIYGGNIELHKRCLGNSSHKLEIDVLLPDVNLGFEYDGLFYHSEKNFIPKNYHLMKTNEANKLGITLIHVFESEWTHKRDIVKSRIRNLLGVHDKVVYARKCKVVNLGKNETCEFMNRTHLQGECVSSVNLGLSYNGEIVSVMTFGKSRFNKRYEWELLRFSNELGHHVIGGAGKMLRYFEKNYKPISLISYADKRWSIGNMYVKLGFSHIGDSKPNYWYFKGTNLESRIKFQKHKLPKLLTVFDKNKSESENVRDNGYNRIFDCGNMTFVKEYL